MKVIIFDTSQDFWEISAEFMYHAVLGGMARAAGDNKVSRISTSIFSFLCSVPYLLSWQAIELHSTWFSLCIYDDIWIVKLMYQKNTCGFVFLTTYQVLLRLLSWKIFSTFRSNYKQIKVNIVYELLPYYNIRNGNKHLLTIIR